MQLFMRLQTQWRVSFADPVGLDYSAIESLFRMVRVPHRERNWRLEQLQVMEDEALAVWSRKS